MTNPNPALYCAARSKATLNVQQFRQMHEADAKKAGWSARQFLQAKRQLGLHDALCPECVEAMHQ